MFSRGTRNSYCRFKTGLFVNRTREKCVTQRGKDAKRQRQQGSNLLRLFAFLRSEFLFSTTQKLRPPRLPIRCRREAGFFPEKRREVMHIRISARDGNLFDRHLARHEELARGVDADGGEVIDDRR